eukprot:361820-Chlamydomonas_euryale.AAC.1
MSCVELSHSASTLCTPFCDWSAHMGALQVMWREHAFLVGALRRPLCGQAGGAATVSTGAAPWAKRGGGGGGAGGGGAGVGGRGLSVSADVMADGSARDALLRLRNELRLLVDARALGGAAQKYARARADVFRHSGGGGGDGRGSGSVPVLFPSDYSSELQAYVSEQAAEVAAALVRKRTRRPPRPRAAPALQARQGHAGVRAEPPGVRAGGGGTAAAALPASPQPPLTLHIGGIYGDLIRREQQRKQQQPPVTRARLAVPAGLPASAQAVLRRQAEREAEVLAVEHAWLTQHASMLRSDAPEGGAAGTPDDGGRGGGGGGGGSGGSQERHACLDEQSPGRGTAGAGALYCGDAVARESPRQRQDQQQQRQQQQPPSPRHASRKQASFAQAQRWQQQAPQRARHLAETGGQPASGTGAAGR